MLISYGVGQQYSSFILLDFEVVTPDYASRHGRIQNYFFTGGEKKNWLFLNCEKNPKSFEKLNLTRSK